MPAILSRGDKLTPRWQTFIISANCRPFISDLDTLIADLGFNWDVLVYIVEKLF